ncbi:phasin family protein [Noviherbaspirillum sp. UKPF54]|uniref:phasin family protein n=1 Tax=Noviherbaspirillum sp. UKPF54 TaxID=2601898 RepID=UPI00143DF46D|nr:phasin family protein [Noviherbaspirillum sp. UKPF54]
MTKKLHDATQIQEVDFKDAVRNSAQQIWQAGLGAFSIARDEGSGLLARLMKEGASLQTRTQRLAGQTISGAIARMSETLGRQTAVPLGKMEEVFEERFTRTLRNLGVPTQDDLKALTEEIDGLCQSVTALSNAGARGRRTAARGKEKTVKSAMRKSAAGSRA